MNPTTQTSTYLRLLQIIHIALIAGMVLFAIVTLVIHQADSSPFTSKEIMDILLYIVPAIAIGGSLASNIVFKNRLLEIKSVERLTEKLEGYRSALIIRYALLEGPSLLAIIAYLLTANFFFLGIAAIVILYFASLRPTREKIIYDLELDAGAL